jgi:hypothetical protein
MNFNEKLNIIFENPSVMQIGDSNKIQSMATAGTVTFGWLGDMLLTAEYGSTPAINGVNIDPIELQRLRRQLEPYDDDIETFARHTYHDNIQYHEALIMFVVQYLVMKEASQMLKQGHSFEPEGEDLWKMLDKYYKMQSKEKGERDGLNPAGRLFKSIKGISFYGPMPPKAKILQLLKVAGQSPEGYTIEYRDGMKINQVPLQGPRFVTQGKEEDEQQTVQLAKMRLRDLQKDKTFGKKKDIFQHYSTTQGG